MASDVISGVLALAGAIFTLLAGVGVLKFPDTLSRMQAATKATTLGMLLIVAATVVSLGGDAIRLVLALGLVFITAPVAAHLVGRAAYRHGGVTLRVDQVDELADEEARPGRGEPGGAQ